MEVGNKAYESPRMEVHKGVMAGLAAGGAIGSAKVALPQIKDSFSKSIEAQKATLDKFNKSEKTVDEFINGIRKKIDAVANPGSVQKTMNYFQEKGDRKKLEAFKAGYSEIVEKGTKASYSELSKTEKLLTSGKPSKLTAAKDAALAFCTKVKNKFSPLKENMQTNLKSQNGVKGKFSAIKTTITDFLKQNPSIKKAGKFALAGALIGASASLIHKAVSGGTEK